MIMEVPGPGCSDSTNNVASKRDTTVSNILYAKTLSKNKSLCSAKIPYFAVK